MQGEFEFPPSTTRAAKADARSAAPLRRRQNSGERQLVLPGYELYRADNFFFAIRPDEAAVRQVDDMARSLAGRYGLRGGRLGGGRYHVTLHGLGVFDGMHRGVVAKAEEAARSVVMPAFEVCFGRAVSFRREGKRALVLLGSEGNVELREFHRRLGEAMRRSGLGRNGMNGFTPHVTMLYDFRSVTEETIPSVKWMVRDFVLIHSPHGLSTHFVLNRWQLQG